MMQLSFCCFNILNTIWAIDVNLRFAAPVLDVSAVVVAAVLHSTKLTQRRLFPRHGRTLGTITRYNLRDEPTECYGCGDMCSHKASLMSKVFAVI